MTSTFQVTEDRELITASTVHRRMRFDGAPEVRTSRGTPYIPHLVVVVHPVDAGHESWALTISGYRMRGAHPTRQLVVDKRSFAEAPVWLHNCLLQAPTNRAKTTGDPR